jgi:uncharacterized membrane protein
MTIRNIQFEEKQRFTSWWLWTLLIGITLIPVYGIFQQIIMGTPFGDNPMPDYGLLLFLLFMLLFMGFFWILQLTTTITDESIQIVFFPFVRKNSSGKRSKISSWSIMDLSAAGESDPELNMGRFIIPAEKQASPSNLRMEKSYVSALKRKLNWK